MATRFTFIASQGKHVKATLTTPELIRHRYMAPGDEWRIEMNGEDTLSFMTITKDEYDEHTPLKPIG